MQFVDNYPMKNITTLQIGGPAKKYVSVKTPQELMEAIQYANGDNLEYLVIGGGSNLLVSDEGVDKIIIKNEITGIEHQNHSLKVKSGTNLQELVDYTIQHGLSGIQKMTGIPGTVGGAVCGNAGAYGQTISDHLTSVVILNSSVIPAKARLVSDESERAGIYTNDTSLICSAMTKEKCRFNYRDSVFKQSEDTIVEVTFNLGTGDPKQLEQDAEEVLAKRLIKYPKGIKCPGSFFKNIVAESLAEEILQKIPLEKIMYGKLPVGALLEMVGAKGDSLDGIYIADYHANLFVNKGGGTAKAFYELAKKYADLVKQKFGITLEPEVQLINLPVLI